MKRKTVTFSLGLSLIVGILSSFSASANSFAGRSVKGSFLRSIDLSVTPFRLPEIQTKIEAHAASEGAYLSLGESHGEDSSTHPVQKILAASYVESASTLPFKFCSESIASFLESAEGIWLKEKAHLTEIYTGNGPTQTDFKRCASDAYSRYVTYSGFFHQTPFARAFPEVFTPTPVVTDDGNNIRDQMGDRAGFFVSQIEFPVLELFETNRVLHRFASSSKDFEAEARALIAQGDALRSRMSSVFLDSSIYTSKNGIFVDQRFFRASKLSVLPPENAYLLLTDLEFRKSRPSFYFLSRILALPPADRSLLAKFMKKWKIYYSQADIVPARDGTPGEMTFGLLPQVYRGEAAELTLAHGKDLLFFTMSGDDSELTCVATESGSEATASAIPCSEALRKFAR